MANQQPEGGEGPPQQPPVVERSPMTVLQEAISAVRRSRRGQSPVANHDGLRGFAPPRGVLTMQGVEEEEPEDEGPQAMDEEGQGHGAPLSPADWGGDEQMEVDGAPVTGTAPPAEGSGRGDVPTLGGGCGGETASMEVDLPGRPDESLGALGFPRGLQMVQFEAARPRSQVLLDASRQVTAQIRASSEARRMSPNVEMRASVIGTGAQARVASLTATPAVRRPSVSISFDGNRIQVTNLRDDAPAPTDGDPTGRGLHHRAQMRMTQAARADAAGAELDVGYEHVDDPAPLRTLVPTFDVETASLGTAPSSVAGDGASSHGVGSRGASARGGSVRGGHSDNGSRLEEGEQPNAAIPFHNPATPAHVTIASGQWPEAYTTVSRTLTTLLRHREERFSGYFANISYARWKNGRSHRRLNPEAAALDNYDLQIIVARAEKSRLYGVFSADGERMAFFGVFCGWSNKKGGYWRIVDQYNMCMQRVLPEDLDASSPHRPYRYVIHAFNERQLNGGSGVYNVGVLSAEALRDLQHARGRWDPQGRRGRNARNLIFFLEMDMRDFNRHHPELKRSGTHLAIYDLYGIVRYHGGVIPVWKSPKPGPWKVYVTMGLPPAELRLYNQQEGVSGGLPRRTMHGIRHVERARGQDVSSWTWVSPTLQRNNWDEAPRPSDYVPAVQMQMLHGENTPDEAIRRGLGLRIFQHPVLGRILRPIEGHQPQLISTLRTQINAQNLTQQQNATDAGGAGGTTPVAPSASGQSGSGRGDAPGPATGRDGSSGQQQRPRKPQTTNHTQERPR
ncbi:MAG: hypothetical protein CMC97_06610, partial [Flavobacteriales bacterium]|nr:hypothetical protein [Flavobacteriales bacterium]